MNPKPKTTARAADRLFWAIVGASAVLVLLTFVASRFVTEPTPPAGAGRMLPRIRGAPATPGEFLRMLGVGSLIWYACFLSAPLFVWMNRRLRFTRRAWPISVALYTVTILAIAAVTATIQYRLTYGNEGPPLDVFVKLGLITGTLPLLTVAAVTLAIDARSRAHERELESERFRTQLAETRLEALTAQLQPHFLFNTLQGISTLIRHDAAAADAMLASLSDLLRDVLRRDGRREVELAEELRVLESYLDISRRRFGDRLAISVDVDRSAAHALVPFFVLQPLVENAIHHGVSSHAGTGTVSIRASRDGDRLVLSVEDDGPGTAIADSGRGIGLANTQARLEQMYGAHQSLDFGRRSERGFRVTATIPYRTS